MSEKKTGVYGEPWRLAGPYEYPWALGPVGAAGEPTCTILANDGYGVMSVPKALAHFPASIGDAASGMSRAPRMIECVNAMTGIKDPAAFMEEVREVLGSLMARVDVDRLWEQQRQGFGGGSVPEMYDAGLVPDEFLRASALLEKMEGK